MTSNRFEDLQRRVVRLKIRKYSKIFFIFFILFGSIAYIGYIKVFEDTLAIKPLHVEKIEEKVEPVKQIEEEVEEIKVLHVEPVKQIEVKQIETNQSVVNVKEEDSYDTMKLTPTIVIPEDTIQGKRRKEIAVVEEKKTIEKNSINFNIKEVKSEDALLERFSLAGDYLSAVGLASLYFEKDKFEKAIFWSKKASKIMPDSKDPWIVYAKSKVALNQKEDAIKSLELFLNYFSSDDIEKLLNIYKGSEQ